MYDRYFPTKLINKFDMNLLHKFIKKQLTAAKRTNGFQRVLFLHRHETVGAFPAAANRYDVRILRNLQLFTFYKKLT